MEKKMGERERGREKQRVPLIGLKPGVNDAFLVGLYSIKRVC